MANKVKNGGSIATQTQNKAAAKKQPTTIKEWIGVYKAQFARALPSTITPERFTRMALSAVNNLPKLQECTIPSFLGAMMNAATLGLEPNTTLGQAYILPYYNRKTEELEAQFQLGYKGMIDLAYRSGQVKSIQAHVARENDTFDYAFGLEPKLLHIPARGDRGKATHVYAVFMLTNGGYGFDVLTIEAVNIHAQTYSPSFEKKLKPLEDKL